MMFCCLVVSSLFFLMVDAGCDTALRREICYLLIRPMTPAACINYPSYSRKSFLELQSDVVAPRTPLLLGAWRHGWGILKVASSIAILHNFIMPTHTETAVSS